VLADPQSAWKYRSSQPPAAIDAAVRPDEMKEVLALAGPKAIERLTLKLAATDRDRALRQVVLHIQFDDHPWAQVQAPIGDFFGTAPGVNPYNSVPFTVEPDGTMTCRFFMPFARSCKLMLQNLGDQPATVTGNVLPMDYAWNDASSTHFRARWRVNHELVADGDTRTQDIPFLVANGSGRYVGTAVMLLNPSPIPTTNGSWWGEGDEKVFVDEDIRPSTFGTGSEDYFNYAWSSADIFVFPYCGQTRNDGPGTRGFVSDNRWHILDSLPFRQRMGFYLELYSHERVPGFSYARIGYHYARPGLMDDHLAITREDVRPLKLPANWQPAARRAAANSVFYQAEDVVIQESRDRVKTSLLDGDLWAGGRGFVWRPAKSGEELAFRLPVAEDGQYVIHLTAGHTPVSGKFSAMLEGKRIGFGGDAGISLYEPYRTMSRDHASDQIRLNKGVHDLTLRYEGPAGDSPSAEVVVDFVGVQKRK
jgi:hypothetical protein